MTTKVFFKRIQMVSNVSDAGAVNLPLGQKHTLKWRDSLPSFKDIETFCQETESFANENDMRVVSITPVTGGKDLTDPSGGTSMTCGFVVVFESRT